MMRKLAPCCKNEDIFALTRFATIFCECFLVRVHFSFGEKKELDFWTKNAFLREAIFEVCFCLVSVQKRMSCNFHKQHQCQNARPFFPLFILSFSAKM